MHPVFARFLDEEELLETLGRAERGEPLTPEEKKLAEAARASPEFPASLGAPLTPPHDRQRAVLCLAAQTTVHVLAESHLASAVEGARRALLSRGASAEEASQFLAGLVLEEAFGFDDEAAHFDEALFQETLVSVPSLAALDTEGLDALEEAFVADDPTDGPLRRVVLEALFQAAWSDGPEPIGPEHVEDAKRALADRLSDSDLARAHHGLVQLVAFLAARDIVGPLRREHLFRAARRAFARPGGDGHPTEEDERG